MSQRGRVLVPVLALALVVGQFESAFARDRVIVDRRQKGYRVRASSAWTVKSIGAGEDSSIEREDPFCNIGVIVTPATGDDGVTRAVVRQFYEGGRHQFASSNIVKQKIETLRGKPSGWIEFTGELKNRPNRPIHARFYVTLHRGYLYIIMVLSEEDTWKKAWPHARKVVQSMEFL